MASPPSTVESSIRGNVSEDVKNDIHHVMNGLVFEPTFAWSVGNKLRITDVDRLQSSGEALVNEQPLETATARVICELDVDECEPILFPVSFAVPASNRPVIPGLSNVRQRRSATYWLCSILDGLVSNEFLDSF